MPIKVFLFPVNFWFVDEFFCCYSSYTDLSRYLECFESKIDWKLIGFWVKNPSTLIFCHNGGKNMRKSKRRITYLKRWCVICLYFFFQKYKGRKQVILPIKKLNRPKHMGFPRPTCMGFFFKDLSVLGEIFFFLGFIWE